MQSNLDPVWLRHKSKLNQSPSITFKPSVCKLLTTSVFTQDSHPAVTNIKINKTDTELDHSLETCILFRITNTFLHLTTPCKCFQFISSFLYCRFSHQHTCGSWFLIIVYSCVCCQSASLGESFTTN